MTTKCVGAIAGFVMAVALLVAQPVLASTEVGNQCVGNSSAENYTIAGTANASGPLTPTVPSAGVITRWTFNVEPIPSGVLTETLKILRPTGVPGQLQVAGESAPGAMATGLNSFSTRLPVKAGDLLGSSGIALGKVITVYCETGNPGDRLGAVKGNPGLGATFPFEEEVPGVQNPVTAVVEPDVDNDGYGDETQDKCPQSAAVQSECPKVKVDIGSAVKKKGSVVVSLTTSSEAPVTVAGVVKLGKGRKAKLSGGKKTVKPGKITRFTLKFPAKLKAALADLPKGRSLPLKVTASARDVIGRVTKDQVKVRLRG
jgi:hypothetical protein